MKRVSKQPTPKGQDLYNTTKTRVDEILEEVDPEDDAIMEELAELLKDLDKYNYSVTTKKQHLDKLISQGCEGEIEIVVFDPVNIRKHRERGRNITSSPQILTKRKRTIVHYKEPRVGKAKGQKKAYKSTKTNTAFDKDAIEEDQLQNDESNTSDHPTPLVFNDSHMDLSKIIKGVTPHEVVCITSFAILLPSHQFNWGRALGASVRNIIHCLGHALPPVKATGSLRSLELHVVKLKEICNHKDMINFLKTELTTFVDGAAPNLLQLSAANQFLTQDSIKWELLKESTNHPWSKRNGVFRALHSMACRTDDTIQWTSESSINNKLKCAYLTIRQILLDSIGVISYHTGHKTIQIHTTGVNAVPDDMVNLAKGIGWVYQQIMIRDQVEEENDLKKVHKHGIAWLQKRYLQVFLGVMVIYENEIYNQKFEAYVQEPRSQADIKKEKKRIKEASCLNQLSQSWVNHHPERVLKASSQTITNTSDLDKLTDDQQRVQAVRDASETRSNALRALSLFLMFGTAGLFHVWTNRREVLLHDSSYLLNLTSILALRHHNSKDKDPNAFLGRAWCRLDDYVITTLGRFLNNDGKFVEDLDWAAMTERLNDDFEASRLTPLFILDLYEELFTLGRSRTPEGYEAPPVNFAGRKNFPNLTIDCKNYDHDSGSDVSSGLSEPEDNES
ncbi:uncharacterized protein MELLADRAFT_105751 [Melampsora larici-populina 98AG31]|uniref:Uncharacterized protein n=1 Tax=Melampsora larici-populina (strain 98AG31 / pathotype 3-4-7) TaxID=747676 RepID=F4RJ74_MELLP|nr:uncharacterized protein MELLADRAFT_105751 [Melampsora larici-populina 98AG31]EGG07271.1 hypothetical protein MELLADRAFT_105751 [Melampsora larici-populina 98AG31]